MRAVAITSSKLPARCRVPNPHRRYIGRKLDRGRGILDDDQLHRVVLEDSAHGILAQPVINRREDRPQSGHREERLEKSRVALAEPSDPVAAHALRVPASLTRAADAFGQFHVGPPCRTVHQRDVVGCDPAPAVPSKNRRQETQPSPRHGLGR